jgi:GH43 family beta-xylosidase
VDADKVVMTIEQINVLTARARALPPSGDQTNVLVSDGEDPWVVSHDDRLYYCTVDRAKRKVLVATFDDITGMADATPVPVWPSPRSHVPPYEEIWSPELHRLDARWYIYLSLYDGNHGHERIHVLEGASDDPQGEYVYGARLEAATDRWSIDGSVLQLPDGRRFLVWSGWDGHENSSQNIYIASMASPSALGSDRVCISRPEYDWERRGYPWVNEGPQPLVHDGRVFVVFSASGSWTDDYCLGLLTLAGEDPLDPESWVKRAQPVFSRTETITGPGHACFLHDAGGDWLIYHAARSTGAGWARQVRAKRFSWRADGSPEFGRPE